MIITTIIIIITIEYGGNRNQNFFNSTYQSLRAIGGHRLHYQKYTPKLILKYLQELINNLLNLQTTYAIAASTSYQNFITDILKLKYS